MRRFIFLAATVAMAVFTAVAFAQTPNGRDRANAARLCKAQRATLGAAAFQKLYGSPSSARNAYGKCVSRTAKTLHQNRTNAAQQCKAEQNDANFASTHGGKTFAQFYGTNSDLSNAFANCVSLKLGLLNTLVQQQMVNPASLCRAQQSAMGSRAFNALYGTNDNARNAFGKCVSRTAQLLQANGAAAESQCRTEQSDANFASSHGGKTFVEFYGTNANGSNAFVNCVLQKLQQLTQQQQQATVNAARQCDAERSQIGDKAFRKKYGTNGNGANAFGNCVSQHAQQH